MNPSERFAVRTVVRLVHQSHDHSVLLGIFLGQFTPEVGKVLLSKFSGLTKYHPIPAPIVVDINDAMTPGFQACLHQLIVKSEVPRLEMSAQPVVDQELPPNR
jgi:hypothetical protein